ncbi:MAG TPA: carbonate dehydratase [Saprospiraceae bacterium]|nr:carbonate dehydratase [Saprospiraceae bacterium]HRO09811.1 carbonate dehydratase [Saprospiraceae bacterium]HRO72948.1 carbonate dehydratase [Saprospiraceae bacterium]HRP43066.1 carbonate dehydratase [Saprospiraceae bacterium]
MPELYNTLLSNNKKWVAEITEKDPDFFINLSKGQAPPVLWIGCADSRVPANVITGTKPGEIFVHRNIANMVIHTDMNMLSVLDYAVNVLHIRHIIVCGHYGCGGVRAALSNTQFGIIDNWIRHIKDVYRLHNDELNALTDENERFDRLVELNVIEQVLDLAKTSIVQNAWKNKEQLWLHGWVYSLENGLVKDLDVNFGNDSELPVIYKLNA